MMFSSAFMVLVFVLTQTVSHSFPKLCAALQKNDGNHSALPVASASGLLAERGGYCRGTYFGASEAKQKPPHHEA